MAPAPRSSSRAQSGATPAPLRVADGPRPAGGGGEETEAQGFALSRGREGSFSGAPMSSRVKCGNWGVGAGRQRWAPLCRCGPCLLSPERVRCSACPPAPRQGPGCGRCQGPDTTVGTQPHVPPVPRCRGARGRGRGRMLGRLAGARLCGEGPVFTARSATACQVSGKFLLPVTLKGIRPDSNVRRKQSLLSHHLSHAP